MDLTRAQLPISNAQLPHRRRDTQGAGGRGNSAFEYRSRHPEWSRGRDVGRWKLTAAVLLAAAAVACGKKGPPLAPIIHVPAAVQSISARRQGHDVYVTLTVPAQNIDASTPADVTRIDVYGYTGLTPPPRGRFLEGAALVAMIPVAPVPPPGETRQTAVSDAQQGLPVTIRDPLEQDDLIATPLPPPPVTPRTLPPVQTTAPVPQGPLRRFYMALPFNGHRPGPQGTVAELVLTPLPDAPARLDVAYTADMVTLSWEPSGGLFGFLLDAALPVEPPPFAEVAASNAAQAAAAPSAGLANLPAGPTQYNIYRDIAPDPLILAVSSADDVRVGETPRSPVNPQPVTALTLNDPLMLDERERCYVVRAVLGGVGANAVEGDPSPRVCLTPIDIFPPAMPSGLNAVLAPGSIRLIWDANTEGDLAGYVVLRGEAGSATLTTLTRDGPVLEAQFVDDTVKPGVRYVYEVVAVDSRVPLPNVSAAARIEETAR